MLRLAPPSPAPCRPLPPCPVSGSYVKDNRRIYTSRLHSCGSNLEGLQRAPIKCGSPTRSPTPDAQISQTQIYPPLQSCRNSLAGLERATTECEAVTSSPPPDTPPMQGTSFVLETMISLSHAPPPSPSADLTICCMCECGHLVCRLDLASASATIPQDTLPLLAARPKEYVRIGQPVVLRDVMQKFYAEGRVRGIYALEFNWVIMYGMKESGAPFLFGVPYAWTRLPLLHTLFYTLNSHHIKSIDTIYPASRLILISSQQPVAPC